MKTFGCTLLIMLVHTTTVFAAPLVLGLSTKHPLSEPQVGELLISELRCAACHNRKDASQAQERQAPDLSDVGSRVSPDFLRRFIASPSNSHSGTTMPDMLAAETADERNKIAEAITLFLIAQSPGKFQREAIREQEATAGKALFHSVGCVACHGTRDAKGEPEKLFATSDNSFATSDLSKPEIDTSKGAKGPFTLGAAITYNTGQPNSQGRVVVTGSSGWVANSILGFQGNRDLVLNMLNWLSSDEDLISIRPKDPADNRIMLSGRQMTLLFFTSVVLLPLAIIVMGVSVWWRRR